MSVIRDPKTFCFNFDWSNDVNESLKHKTKFIKTNESLANNKMKNKIEQLLLKFKHVNDIHELKKQKNE